MTPPPLNIDSCFTACESVGRFRVRPWHYMTSSNVAHKLRPQHNKTALLNIMTCAVLAPLSAQYLLGFSLAAEWVFRRHNGSVNTGLRCSNSRRLRAKLNWKFAKNSILKWWRTSDVRNCHVTPSFQLIINIVIFRLVPTQRTTQRLRSSVSKQVHVQDTHMKLLRQTLIFTLISPKT